MEYIVLTETEFFRLINTDGSHDSLHTAYREFTDRIVRLCQENGHHATLALTFAETELQFHDRLNSGDTDGVPHLYIRKALAFVRKVQKHITSQVPPLNPQSTPSKTDTHHKMAQPPAALRWTGKASDLVEILYGMAETGCINDGEIPVGELASFFYSLFNVEAKDCYRIYSDLKLRKSDSRTYFLDKMQEKLNNRMNMDEAKDRRRR